MYFKTKPYAGLNCRNPDNLSLLFQRAYAVDNPNPIAPPKPHFLSPAVDLYRHPVAVAATIVLRSSSFPLTHDRITPKAEYITATDPNVFAVAPPFFIM